MKEQSENTTAVLKLAREESKRLGHNYVGTEHILLGIIKHAQNTAYFVFRLHDVNLGEISNKLESIIGNGGLNSNEEAPLTPRVKKVLELAGRTTTTLRQRTIIGTGDVIAGIMLVGEGGAAIVLREIMSRELFDATVNAILNDPVPMDLQKVFQDQTAVHDLQKRFLLMSAKANLAEFKLRTIQIQLRSLAKESF